MLQFAKLLDHKGVKVTLVTTRYIYKTMQGLGLSCLSWETISDGFDEGGMREAGTIDAYVESFWKVGSRTFSELLEKLLSSASPADCVIYDAFIPWSLDVAKKFGIAGTVFFTQSCAVDSIYYHVHEGLLKLPIADDQSQISLPGLPPLDPLDFPSFVYDLGSYPAFYELVVGQFSNVDKADWVLCNTFYELEEQVVDWMAKLWRLRTVGPTIPSKYLDKQLDGKEYGVNLLPNNDADMKWLNGRPKGSVAYVSFGSVVALAVEQMEELAWGLKRSNSNFLWVVRESEAAKVSKGFTEETSEKGLMVSWCPQMEVLADEAVGCFITHWHCGWNSNLEALSLGVPMVALPQWMDQRTNAKYIMDVWKIGVKAPTDEKGVVRQQVIEHCINEVMEGKRGEEIRKSAAKWRELARKAVAEGGSSDQNIDEFIAKLKVQS